MQQSVYNANGRYSASIAGTATEAAPTQTVQMAAVKIRQQRKVRRMAPLLLIVCLALAIFTVLLVPMLVDGAAASSAKTAVVEEQRVVQEFTSLKEAADVLGFLPNWPATVPDGYAITAFRVVNESMLEIEYTSAKGVVQFRMAPGSDDLSDAQTEYAYTVTETANDITRSYAGVADQKLNLAVWAHDEYSYALVALSGIDAAHMRMFAESVA